MGTDQQITDLQARIDQLEHEQEALRDALAEAQLEQWEGRLDDLDVQLHLGGMELRDRVEPILEPLRSQIAEARTRVENGASTASEAVRAIRTGFEQAWDDLRSAITQARSIVNR